MLPIAVMLILQCLKIYMVLGAPFVLVTVVELFTLQSVPSVFNCAARALYSAFNV